MLLKKAQLAGPTALVILGLILITGFFLFLFLGQAEKAIDRLSLRENCKNSLIKRGLTEGKIIKFIGEFPVECFPHTAKVEDNKIYFKLTPKDSFKKDKDLPKDEQQSRESQANYVAQAMFDCYYQYLQNKPLFTDVNQYFCAPCDYFFGFKTSKEDILFSLRNSFVTGSRDTTFEYYIYQGDLDPEKDIREIKLVDQDEPTYDVPTKEETKARQENKDQREPFGIYYVEMPWSATGKNPRVILSPGLKPETINGRDVCKNFYTKLEIS